MQQTVKTLLLTGLTFIASCSDQPQITLINQAPVPLTQVVASGHGFSEVVGAIAPGEQRHISARPTGESGLRLAFTAKGKPFVTQEMGYFEGHYPYKVTVIVKPDFTVTVDSQL